KCASQSYCAAEIAKQSADYRVVCCSTDLCNKDYDTGDNGNYHYYDNHSNDYRCTDNDYYDDNSDNYHHTDNDSNNYDSYNYDSYNHHSYDHSDDNHSRDNIHINGN
ncbi:hypothetical protein AAVH_32584, partial [Aphelenchoides avenae]